MYFGLGCIKVIMLFSHLLHKHAVLIQHAEKLGDLACIMKTIYT